jgi:D-3-phosphoglycerate dehydrogenase
MSSLAAIASRHSNRLFVKYQVRAFATPSVDLDHYSSGWNISDLGEFTKAGKYQIQTFNKISEKGLARFPTDRYEVKGTEWDSNNAHAILLRSHKLQESEVDVSVRAIARCGAGTNNVPVARMTQVGIPVFNTPGANANAVKELVLCGMLLGSRRIVDGVNHMKDLGAKGLAKERVEKDKAMFGGQEIKGKTLAVIGLGHIGAATARDADALGMKVVGYDPGLSIESALKLPREISLCDSISAAVANADYISLNIPYIKGEGGTHGIINKDVINVCKPTAVFLNFARGELVNSEDMKQFLDSGNGRYVTDFPDDLCWDHKNAVVLPHLGASTEEAEDAAAAMAADTIRDYLESGAIKNSVNFPTVSLGPRPEGCIRMSVVNNNQPGVLAKITEIFAKHNLNIVQQTNQSRGNVAYNLIDIDPGTQQESINMKDLQKELTMADGVLSSRIVFGTPGIGYARNIDGQYWV